MFRINFFSFVLFFSLMLFKHVFASNLIIKGLERLTIDDLQSLTSINLSKDNYNDDDIILLEKDLFKSDLIKNIELKKDPEFYELTLIENDKIENIYFNGNAFVKDEVLINNLSSKINFFYNLNNIKNDLTLIKNIYLSQGFEDISISVSTERYSNNKINLIFNITEGLKSKITKIEFIGNMSFNDKFLYSLINSKTVNKINLFTKGSNLNREVIEFDINKLVNYYKDSGFVDIQINYKIERLRFSNFKLTFYISEGARLKIDEIKYVYLDGSESDFENIHIKKFNKSLNKNDFFYDKKIIDKYIENLTNLANDNNFLDRAYSYNFFEQQGKNILSIKEEKLPFKLIKNIQIEGNSITKDSTLRSKLKYEPGDYYNNFLIIQSKKDLERLRYINNVEISKVDEEGHTNINLAINENIKTGNLLLGGSFSGDTGFGIGFNLKDSNFIGSGNELDLSIDANAEKALFKLGYSKYSLMNSNISYNYKIYNSEKDFSNSFGFKNKSQGLAYGVLYKINRTTSLSYDIDVNKLKGYSPSNNNTIVTDNIGDYDQVDLSFSINHDNTNNFLYPTNGVSNKFTIVFSPEKISDKSYYKIKVNNKNYYQFQNSKSFIFLSNSLGIADSFNGNLTTTNAFSLGGLNFKGFDYRGIGPKNDNIYLGGNKYFTSTIGYGSSFLFDEKDNINFKIFSTLGSLWDSDYDMNSEFDLRSSAGISLDILTAVGPISLSYAVPIQKNQNDSIREFNFSIGTSF
jgi:outer membrane protein insertion porin family